MYSQNQRIKFKFRRVAAIIFLLFISMGPGCAGTQKTTTVTTAGDREIVNKVETTTTSSESSARHPGVIGSTFRAVGHVIAIPFIAIGGLFRMLFGG